jgi:hypothetical protein
LVSKSTSSQNIETRIKTNDINASMLACSKYTISSRGEARAKLTMVHYSKELV